MSKNKILVIISAVVIVAAIGAGFWLYYSIGHKAKIPQNSPTPVSQAQLGCENSGGKVINALCCTSVGDFPNNCSIGACGCSPENAHQVKTCDCPPGECFNGTSCVSQ